MLRKMRGSHISSKSKWRLQSGAPRLTLDSLVKLCSGNVRNFALVGQDCLLHWRHCVENQVVTKKAGSLRSQWKLHQGQ